MLLNATAKAETSFIQKASASAAKIGYAKDLGASERLDYAGRLRMLSQRIPAATCNLSAGVESGASRAIQHRAIAEFKRILSALEFGDRRLGILGVEKRSRTLKAIKEVHRSFDPLRLAAETTEGSVSAATAVKLAANHSSEVLNSANRLMAEVSSEYSMPASLLQSDAVTIDIAGRQRMLTQKMSKEICQILSQVNVSASRTALRETIRLFEVTHEALRHGEKIVGIKPAPTPEIAQGLDVVKSEWIAIKSYIDVVADGSEISGRDRAAVFNGLNQTMADMNRVVRLYSNASKLGY